MTEFTLLFPHLLQPWPLPDAPLRGSCETTGTDIGRPSQGCEVAPENGQAPAQSSAAFWYQERAQSWGKFAEGLTGVLKP